MRTLLGGRYRLRVAGWSLREGRLELQRPGELLWFQFAFSLANVLPQHEVQKTRGRVFPDVSVLEEMARERGVEFVTIPDGLP